MAIGKKPLDIFAPTTKRPIIGKDVPERIKGRPAAAEATTKATISLPERQILFLDKVALAIRERTGEYVSRSELIRAIIDHDAGSLNTEGPDFDKTIRDLFPILKENE